MERPQEEAYFYKLNRELIEARRKINNEERAKKTLVAGKKSHWMVCPKCGGKMVEKEISKIMLEQCESCHGIYFDEAEFGTLIKAHQQKSFLDYLNKFLAVNEHWTPDL